MQQFKITIILMGWKVLVLRLSEFILLEEARMYLWIAFKNYAHVNSIEKFSVFIEASMQNRHTNLFKLVQEIRKDLVPFTFLFLNNNVSPPKMLLWKVSFLYYSRTQFSNFQSVCGLLKKNCLFFYKFEHFTKQIL